jgi:ATP-binding cassette subfamily B protein
MSDEQGPVKPKFSFPLMWRVIALARPFRKQFIISSALAVVLAVTAPLIPFFIQRTVDHHIMRFNAEGLLWMTMLLVALTVGQSILRYYFILVTSWLGQSVIRNLRVRVFDHIVSLKLRYFDTTPIGTSTTRTINDIETINDIFSDGIISILADLLTMVAVMAFMFYHDWRLTLVCLSSLPLIMFATYVFKEKVKVAFNALRNEVARMNAFLQEHISGMKIVQIFRAEKHEMEAFKAINQQYTRANIKTIWYYSIFFPVIEIISAAAVGLLVWYGANQVVSSKIELGLLIAFYMYINLLFRPLRMLADKFNQLQMGLVASERVFRLLDSTDRIEQTGTIKPKRIQGRIEFENVWFSYDDQDFVLKDVSFSVEPGQTLAIVGATGSGKTSIINVLNRFYDIQKGTIRVDGTDIRGYDLHAYRAHLGNVMQDVFLFYGSIYDNITLRNRDMSLDEVIEAAKVCGIHDFISRLPGKYDYQVMERGGTLSLGQRQLISFIRTLVYNPTVLILDEATSSIDTESEQLIQQATLKLIANRTSIVVAHRLSTIQHADNILVMDKGQIMESGTHDDLLRTEGLYRRLYDLQFREQQVA